MNIKVSCFYEKLETGILGVSECTVLQIFWKEINDHIITSNEVVEGVILKMDL